MRMAPSTAFSATRSCGIVRSATSIAPQLLEILRCFAGGRDGYAARWHRVGASDPVLVDGLSEEDERMPALDHERPRAREVPLEPMRHLLWRVRCDELRRLGLRPVVCPPVRLAVPLRPQDVELCQQRLDPMLACF